MKAYKKIFLSKPEERNYENNWEYREWNFLTFILLKYSWFTMLVRFSYTAKWFSYIYLYLSIYIHSFLYSFPWWFIKEYRIEFSVLYTRTLLFIHSIYNSLNLLIPKSQSFTPPSLPLGNQKSVLYVCETVSVS